MTNGSSSKEAGPDPPGEANDDVIETDPERARLRREARAYVLNTVQIPLLRIAGFTVLLAMVWLHMRYVEDRAHWELLPGLLIAVVLYCIASWALLRRFYRRFQPRDLQLVFLSLDYVLYAAALHVTGDNHSWLPFVLLVHVVDQSTSFLRSLFFAHLAPLCYLSLILVTGNTVDWASETSKIVILYGAGIYVSLTARTSERLRQRLRSTIYTTRELICQLRDRTAELELAMQDAEQANRAKSAFLAAMSHELGTPLNAIIGFAELLLDPEREISEEQRVEFLHYVHNAGKHLLSLIHDVLDLARLESGHLSLRCETTDVGDLAVGVYSVFAPQASERTVAFSLDREPGAHLLEIDARRLRQVLMNVVSNAVKFTPQGGEVVLRVGGTADVVRIEVADTGIGIDAEYHERVFEGFFKAGHPRDASKGGAGLGLALSRRLVGVLGGTMQMKSAPGQGTTITIHFSRVHPAPPVEPEGSSC